MAMLGACSEDRAPLIPRPGELRASETASATPVVNDSANYFSADVLVKATGSAGVKGKTTTREFRYRVVRTLSSTTNKWKTTVTVDPSTFGTTNAARGPGDIARIEIDEAAQTLRMYRRDGVAVAVPKGSDSLRLQIFKDLVKVKSRVPTKPPSQTPSRVISRPQDPRAWMEGLVVSANSAQRALRIDQTQQQFGPARGEVQGATQYVRNDGTRTVEVLMEPTQGLVTEINMADSGRLVQRTRYAYTALSGGGRWLRQTARTEFAPRHGADRPTVIEHTFSNVRFERRGSL